MKALLWLCHVLCLVSYCCVVPQTQRHGLIWSSLIPSIPPLDSSIDIPWLVSISGNCQGIVLSQWWILSTANCLRKMKLSHLDISGVNYPGSILHGQKICLHPRFDTQGGKDPLKADIGLILLEEPIHEDDIPLSQAPNITLKSCSKCRYRSCQVYQYQSSKEFGITRVKKVSVQLLDLSMCHHQHSHLEKTEGFCIQSEPQQDCWVQQASPVLCLLKNHWELVGLIHKTSRICHNPTVIIRTNPYLTWMKQLIKASMKLLNPTSPLLCRTLHESEHIPHSKHGHNYPPTPASQKPTVQSLEENLGISLQTKHLENSPITKHLKNSPGTFNFNEADSFTESHDFFHEKSQILQGDKFLLEQRWTSPAARLPENPRTNSAQYYQDTPLPDTDNSRDYLVSPTAKSSLAQLISDSAISYKSPKADIAETLGFPVTNTDESQDQIMTNGVKQWSLSVDDVIEPWNFHETNMNGSWAQPSDTTGRSWKKTTNIGEYLDSLRAYTIGPWNQPTTSITSTSPSFPSSDKERPWSSFTSDETNKTLAKFWDSLVANETEPISPYLVYDSTWVPVPTGTVEPWSSSSKYYAMESQDQLVSDLVTSQNHPIANMDGLQIANMDVPSIPSKMGTDTLVVAAFEAKITPYQGQSSTIPSEDQSPFRSRIQPKTNNEP